jgi:hypothetical protein
MRRWFDYLRSGRVLRGDALASYLDRGTAVGGTDRGFLFVHAWAGGDSMIFLASNDTGRADVRSLVQRLTALVRDGVSAP